MVAMLAGCGDSVGPRTYEVTGEVTLDGEPLPTEGTIILHHVPPDQDAATGHIVDGTFHLRATERFHNRRHIILCFITSRIRSGGRCGLIRASGRQNVGDGH